MLEKFCLLYFAEGSDQRPVENPTKDSGSHDLVFVVLSFLAGNLEVQSRRMQSPPPVSLEDVLFSDVDPLAQIFSSSLEIARLHSFAIFEEDCSGQTWPRLKSPLSSHPNNFQIAVLHLGVFGHIFGFVWERLEDSINIKTVFQKCQNMSSRSVDSGTDTLS